MKKSLDAKLSLIPQGSKSQKTGKKNDETEPDFEKRFRAKLYYLQEYFNEGELTQLARVPALQVGC